MYIKFNINTMLAVDAVETPVPEAGFDFVWTDDPNVNLVNYSQITVINKEAGQMALTPTEAYSQVLQPPASDLSALQQQVNEMQAVIDTLLTGGGS